MKSPFDDLKQSAALEAKLDILLQVSINDDIVLHPVQKSTQQQPNAGADSCKPGCRTFSGDTSSQTGAYYPSRRPPVSASCRPLQSGQFLDLLKPETIHKVIIDHSHCLHEGITDRWTDELEPISPQILTQFIGFRCLCGDIGR